MWQKMKNGFKSAWQWTKNKARSGWNWFKDNVAYILSGLTLGGVVIGTCILGGWPVLLVFGIVWLVEGTNPFPGCTNGSFWLTKTVFYALADFYKYIGNSISRLVSKIRSGSTTNTTTEPLLPEGDEPPPENLSENQQVLIKNMRQQLTSLNQFQNNLQHLEQERDRNLPPLEVLNLNPEQLTQLQPRTQSDQADIQVDIKDFDSQSINALLKQNLFTSSAAITVDPVAASSTISENTTGLTAPSPG